MGELHQEADDERQDHAQDAANPGQGHGFRDELEADIALARADGFAYANFAGAFRDRHQHNIHYAHAAHQQPNGDDADHQLKDAGHDVTELQAELFGAADAEIVRFVGWDPPPGAQQSANLVIRHRLHARIGLGDQSNLIVLGIVLLVGPVRNEYFHIASLVQRAFLFVKDADHGIEIAIHQQLLAFGGFIRKKALFSVITDDHHFRAMKVFLVRIVAAFLHSAIHHFGIAGSHSTKHNAGELMVLVARGADGLRAVADVRQHFNHHVFYCR